MFKKIFEFLKNWIELRKEISHTNKYYNKIRKKQIKALKTGFDYNRYINKLKNL